MRELASRQTLRHLAERDRDPGDLTHGPLTIAFGATTYPLVCAPGLQENGYRNRRDLALYLASRMPERQLTDLGAFGRVGVVAVFLKGDEGLELLRVARKRTGAHAVVGSTPFSRPLPVPEPTSNAIFTD
jgi:hypothetical protein